jgi:carbonic anhydrase/acetyltransferase-like protein (isoleucine patch superfamily)
MLKAINERVPSVASSAFVHPAAYVVGQVEIGAEVMILPGAVVRGDMSGIAIGSGTVVSEKAVIHGGGEGTGNRYREGSEPEDRSGFFVIGRNVVIHQSAVVHCGRIGDYSNIGSNSTILDGAELADYCDIAAHTIVPPRERIPWGTALRGIPAPKSISTQISTDRRRQLRSQSREIREKNLSHQGLGSILESGLKEKDMVQPIGSKSPNVDTEAWVSEAGYVAGDVTIGKRSSVWPGAVVVADAGSVVIGEYCDIQDNAVVHSDQDLIIGNHVSIAHGTSVHASRIGSNVLVANNSTLLADVEVGDNCIIAAGTLLDCGTKVPSGSIAIGVPAVILPLEATRRERLNQTGIGYSERAQIMKTAGL